MMGKACAYCYVPTIKEVRWHSKECDESHLTNYLPYANCNFNSGGLWDCHLVLCNVILHFNPGKIVLFISKSLARCENILKRHKCKGT